MSARSTSTRQRGRPPVSELTEAQRRTFEVIQEYMEVHEESPTIAELRELLGITTGPVYDSISQLVKKGFLERERYARRGLKILRQPAQPKSWKLVTLPLLGSVAAGMPTLAEENRLGEALVPDEFVEGSECFALKVHGESMRDAGLNDGDTVIVRSQPLARHGEIVVALVDGDATIKRLYWDEERVELRPENRKFQPISITAENDFRIIGKVIAQSSQWS